jgi:hypothetical protein
VRTASIPLLLLFVLTINFSFKTDTDPRKIAKQKADSLIYVLVSKKTFNRHYYFDNKLSSIRTIDGFDVYWSDVPKLTPTEFKLIYKFKNDPTDSYTEMEIRLDTSFNLKSIENLIDESYLIKSFISTNTIKKIINAKQLNNVTQVHFIYEAIPNKKTVKPSIEICNHSKTEKGRCEDCTNILSDCFKIDPISGDIQTQYTQTITVR